MGEHQREARDALTSTRLALDESPALPGSDSAFERLLSEAARLSEPALLPALQLPLSALPLPFVYKRLANGRFEVRRVIGAGGMGVVFEAFDHLRSTRVCLKALTRVDASGIYRLKNEFRSLVDLTHPNLVRLHDLFVDDSRWFFSMDLVEGEPFDRYVRPGGSLDEQRLRVTFPQLVRAVSAIHDAGKLHRDLKPSNVLVTREGRVVVLDFGLAVGLEANAPGQTLTYECTCGTPAYMAPEQAAAERPRRENDLYAVGVMLFEALTGSLPFDGSVLDILEAKRGRAAPSPRERVPGLPRDLTRLCERLLSRDPCERAAAWPELGPESPGRAWSAPEPVQRRLPQLVGRDGELSRLFQAFELSSAGQSAAVLLDGESGVGKTALCEAFCAAVQERTPALVLGSKCYEHESLPFNAFDPLVDALTRYLRQLSPAEAAAHLPRDTFALVRIFPVLGRTSVVQDAPAREVADEQELRRRAFAAFGELLARVRDRRGLVLAFDDLQWMDGDSAALLQYLFKRRESVPMLCLMSYRRAAAAENVHLARTLKSLRSSRKHQLRELSLEPLPEAHMVALVEQLLGAQSGLASERARTIAQESAGNPFLAGELATFVQRSGPAQLGSMSLHALVDAQLARLEPPARRLLELLALADTPLPVELAVAAAHANHADADVLRAAHLVRSGTSSRCRGRRCIECRHDRIREAVAARIAPGDRLARFRALAQELLAAEKQGQHPELLSRCLEGAGDGVRAAEYAERAAEQAFGKMAFEQAARLFTRALELDGRTNQIGRLVRLGEALERAGRGAEAAASYQRAALWTGGALRIDLLRRAGEELLKTGHSVKGTELLRRTCREVGLHFPSGPLDALASLAWATARVRARGLSPGVPSGRYDVRLEMAQTVVSGLIGYLPVQTAGVAGRYLLLALDSGEIGHVVRALGFNALVHKLMQPRGQWSQLLLEHMDALIARERQPELAGFGGVMKGGVAYLEKRFSDARAHLGKALSTLRRCAGVSWYVDVAHMWDQACAFAAGEFNDIVSTTPGLIDEAYRRGRVWAAVMLSGMHGAPAWLSLDDVEGYRAQLATARHHWKPADRPQWPDFVLLLGELMLAVYEGQPLRGLRLLAAQQPAYRNSMLTLGHGSAAHGFALYGGACAASALGQAPSAGAAEGWVEIVKRSAAELGGSGLSSLRGMAEAFAAALALHRGERAAALDGLRQASRDRERAGVHMFAAAARRRLGQLLGGSEGARLVESAELFMHGQGVRNVEAMTELLCPGCRAPDARGS